MTFGQIATSALVGAALLFQDVNGHAYQSIPKSRTVKHNGGPLGPGDLQSFNKGGPCGLNGGMIAGTPFGPTTPDAAETFAAGSTFDIEIITTAHHKGWYEFRLCRPADGGADKSVPVTQECLNQHVLEFDEAFTKSSYLDAMPAGISSPADYAHVPDTVKMFGHPGSCINNGGQCSDPNNNKDRWVLPESGKVPGNTYQLKYKLPSDVTCDRCILQWHWQTGNSPFSFPEGFWGCTDIKIVSSGPTVPPTPFPTAFPTTPKPTQSTPTKPPTPQATTPAGEECVRLVDFVPEGFCDVPNACVDFPAECGFVDHNGDVPTKAPTRLSSGGDGTCHSLVSHIPDSWCQGVKCDPVYFQFCSTGEVQGTPAPTQADVPATRAPTGFPTNLPANCQSSELQTSQTINGALDVTRVQVDVNVPFAEVTTEYVVGNEWKVSLTASKVPLGKTVAVLFDPADDFTGNSFSVQIKAVGDVNLDTNCKPEIEAVITVPQGTAWEENVAALRETGYANADGTSGFYIFLPVENPGEGSGDDGNDIDSFSCGGCNGCLWVEYNACYSDWDSKTCAGYHDLGYRFCSAGLSSSGSPSGTPSNTGIYAAVAAVGVAAVVGLSVLFVRKTSSGGDRAKKESSKCT